VAFDITGGLRWHGRAFMRRKTLWQPTRLAIADWLAQTSPANKHLLLIGGSAGWMMSSDWLQQFQRIDLYDLDPLAGLLFRLNHGRALKLAGTKLYFHRRDAIQDLEILLSQHPSASIFFDNVLGQLRFRIEDDDQAEQSLEKFYRRLNKRDWGSIHDLYSGPVNHGGMSASQSVRFQGLQTAQGLSLEGLQGAAAQSTLLRAVGASGNWMDHFTSAVFPTGLALHLMSWQFSSNYCHWLQAGWVGTSVSQK
jgi:hypothetical protein